MNDHISKVHKHNRISIDFKFPIEDEAVKWGDPIVLEHTPTPFEIYVINMLQSIVTVMKLMLVVMGAICGILVHMSF